MVETLQMVLRKSDGDPVDTDWAYQIVCGSHGVEQMALCNFVQGGPTWIALKGFIRNKFIPARDQKLQQMEALNEKPLPGENISTYTNRWFNGVHHTWVEQLREAGHVEFLVRALILNCTPAYHLNTTAVMLLNQNLVALLSSTREPQNVFLKIQAQLIELAGPQFPNTSPPQVYRARVAKDEPCFRYQQGRCKYPADVCDRQHVDAPPQFGSAHTPYGGHRPTNAPRSVTFAVAPCRDFTRGECQRGTACRFAHNNTPGRQALTYGDRRRQSALPSQMIAVPKNA